MTDHPDDASTDGSKNDGSTNRTLDPNFDLSLPDPPHDDELQDDSNA